MQNSCKLGPTAPCLGALSQFTTTTVETLANYQTLHPHTISRTLQAHSFVRQCKPESDTLNQHLQSFA